MWNFLLLLTFLTVNCLSGARTVAIISDFPVDMTFTRIADYGPILSQESDPITIEEFSQLDRRSWLKVGKRKETVLFFDCLPLVDLRRVPYGSTLFLWEPPTVCAEQYSPIVLSNKRFSKVYTWDDDLVDNSRFFKFYYPVLRPMLKEIPTFEEKKLCTQCCSFFKSSYPRELYSERLKVIEFFETFHPEDFEFYGSRGWDNTAFKTYKGTIPDKFEVLKNYRFSFCYENTRDIRGYITEKIFDCFAAGTVPIYWGASNIENYIPKECFIDRRQFQTLEQLYVFIRTMGKDEYEQYLRSIRGFLASDKARLFSKEHYHEILRKSISR